MSMITEQVERLRKAADFRHTIGDYMTAGLHREAANTIEAYQKAFEDIRADVEQYEADCILATDSKECKECDKIVFGSIYHIIDKHNPDKVGIEDKEKSRKDAE